jgi:hypothetical protein
MYIARVSVAAPMGAFMITLTIILLLVFVPPFRRALSRMFWSVLAAVGIVFLIAPRSGPRRRGL